MSKKGPLTKVDKFYIDNNSGLTVEELASDLNRSVATISKHRKTKTKHVSSVKEDASSSIVGDLMGNTTGSKRKGVTIMTPAASELSDETKSTSESKINTSVVHRIKK